MSSKKTDDDSSSDKPSENSSANDDPTNDLKSEVDGDAKDDQSPEAIAAAAIKAAKASASDDDTEDDPAGEKSESAASASDDDSEDDASEKEAKDESDPLGFDDARMPEGEGDGVDLSAVDTEAEDDSPEAQLAAANAKADEHWNRVLRMQADLENERKRTQKQVANAHKFAIEGFVNELLPIKDSLEMGLVAAKGDDADLTKIVEGSELTLKLLAQAFEKFHISEVDPMDEKFDPNVHQAMSMQEAEGKDANTVIGVMQKGYTLNDRLIRPALVTVSK